MKMIRKILAEYSPFTTMSEFIDFLKRHLVGVGVFAAVVITFYLIPGLMDIEVEVHGWGWGVFMATMLALSFAKGILTGCFKALITFHGMRFTLTHTVSTFIDWGVYWVEYAVGFLITAAIVPSLASHTTSDIYILFLAALFAVASGFSALISERVFGKQEA